MRFEGTPIAQIDGPQGARSFEPTPDPRAGMEIQSDGLHTTGFPGFLPEAVATHVYERLIDADQLAIYARLQPGSLTASGPARILSLSLEPALRCFTLGQQGRNLVFRVRTPTTGLNGADPQLMTFDEPLTGQTAHVWAAFDGVRSWVDVDGVCRGERLLAEPTGGSVLGAPLALILVIGVALAALGGSIGFPLRSSRRRVTVAFLAGAIFLALFRLGGGWAHLPYFDLLGPLLGVGAVFAVLPLVGSQPAGQTPTKAKHHRS